MRKRVLLTGAFGNVGRSAARELLRQGYVVRCFDLKSKANQKAADKLAGQIEVRWGDVRHLDDVQAAVMDQDVVIHLVAIIPPLSEIHPDWSRQINVGGTRNVITAMQSLAQSPKLIYTSSVALLGRDQNRPPPRTVADPIQITGHYPSHKAGCEEMVRASGLRWAIFRLGAVVPIAFAAAPYHTDWMDTTEGSKASQLSACFFRGSSARSSRFTGWLAILDSPVSPSHPLLDFAAVALLCGQQEKGQTG